MIVSWASPCNGARTTAMLTGSGIEPGKKAWLWSKGTALQQEGGSTTSPPDEGFWRRMHGSGHEHNPAIANVNRPGRFT